MKNNLALVVGCGDLGTRCGRLLLSRGWRLAALSRKPTGLPEEFAVYAADYTVPGSLDCLQTLQPDFVLVTFKPAEPSIQGYRSGYLGAMENLLRGLGQHRPRAVLMASSTRVYGERSGGWVDEDSELSGTDERALAIIGAERLLLDSSLPASVVRFGGIYGAADGRLLRRVREGRLCPRVPPRYSNRLHRDDCAGFLVHLLEMAEQGGQLEPVYTGVDDHPVPQYEVESWLAGEMGVVPRDGCEAEVAGAIAHKRCRNTLLRSSGYQLLYPDYRSGYGSILAP